MPKTLTRLQEAIVAKVLTISATQHVFLRAGEVNSINPLRENGMLAPDCWGAVQHRHLTERIKTVFFADNHQTFKIPNFHGEGWLIFDDRRYITKIYDENDADRVVLALQSLRQLEHRDAA